MAVLLVVSRYLRRRRRRALRQQQLLRLRLLHLEAPLLFLLLHFQLLSLAVGVPGVIANMPCSHYSIWRRALLRLLLVLRLLQRLLLLQLLSQLLPSPAFSLHLLLL